MPDFDFSADLELLTLAGQRGGEIAFSYFRNNPKSWLKGASSSVSEADMAVDTYLKETLLAARPDYGWLSEETADTPDRLGKKRIFIADPIDGTRAFLAGEPDWCVALAVVEDGVPQVAVLVSPALNQTYAAVRGGGATCNGKPLHVHDVSRFEDALVASPPPEGPWAAIHAGRKASFIPSLALRLARVASGEIDAAFAKPNACDWDIASAHLLIEEAGGIFIDVSGKAPAYNRVSVTHPPLAALGPQLAGLLRA